MTHAVSPPTPTGMRSPVDEIMSPQKLALIALIVFAAIIPNLLISALVTERERRQTSVEDEFTRVWGPPQQVYSPILVVPFRSGRTMARQFVRLAPPSLTIAVNLQPQERKRGWFHATVYEARIELQGTFLVPDDSRLRDLAGDRDGQFLWNESFVAFGTSGNLAGFRSDDRIAISGTDTSWQPCLDIIHDERACGGASLILAKAPADTLQPAATVPFKLSASLRGTTSFNVLFGGKDLDVTIRSSWQTPSFRGDVLPVTSTVTAEGFDAHWQTMAFGAPRPTLSSVIVDPAIWKGTDIGVDLIEATPVYRMVNRVAKYSMLFVVLSFATYVAFELLSRLRIHVVQYGMMVLSLSLFSLLLLSLSEPIGYTAGYVASAGLVLIQSTLYTAAVARRAAPALVFGGVLASVFAFLYVLLGLETYSLMIGSLALFIVVSALMVLTQTVNWSAMRHGSETQAEAPTST
jgi:inner membrane protein